MQFAPMQFPPISKEISQILSIELWVICAQITLKFVLHWVITSVYVWPLMGIACSDRYLKRYHSVKMVISCCRQLRWILLSHSDSDSKHTMIADSPLEDYIRKLSQDGEWAGEMVLLALSKSIFLSFLNTFVCSPFSQSERCLMAERVMVANWAWRKVHCAYCSMA